MDCFRSRLHARSSHPSHSHAPRRLLFLMFFLLFPVLAGCDIAPAATIPFIPLERTATPRVTPGLTATASARSPSATITGTPEPTQTPTPYMGIDFGQVELTQGGFLSNLRYFVTFEFPDEVEGQYHAIVDQNKDYKCEVLLDYPKRLYCSGPLVRVYNWADIDLYANGIEQPVWSGEFFVPEME